MFLVLPNLRLQIKFRLLQTRLVPIKLPRHPILVHITPALVLLHLINIRFTLQQLQLKVLHLPLQLRLLYLLRLHQNIRFLLVILILRLQLLILLLNRRYLCACIATRTSRMCELLC